MQIEFYVDPVTQQLHIYNHNVSEQEVFEVLIEGNPLRTKGRGNTRIAFGQTLEGRYLAVVYAPKNNRTYFVITAYELDGKPLAAFRRRRRTKK
jgi:hypothetical protein